MEIPMEKLKLDVEALRIEAFEVEPRGRDIRGTVVGHGRNVEAPQCSILTSPTGPYYCPNQTNTEFKGTCGC
jgi:hypothetical protein